MKKIHYLNIIFCIVFTLSLDSIIYSKGDKNMNEKATFAAGCFWGIEANFSKIDGVISTTVGYTGGHAKNPSYKEVCTGMTGHAEAVEVIFNPEIISYEKLLEYFWNMHNPTTINKQGPDIGNQYRSAIFYHNERQKNIAEKSKIKFQKLKKYSKPIVTEISPAKTFYKAEKYHQKYYEKNGIAACPF